MMASSALKFEELIGRILQYHEFAELNSNVLSRGDEIDFVANRDGLRWAIDVKYYRSAKVALGQIERAAERAAIVARRASIARVLLIVSSEVNRHVLGNLEDRFGVSIVDRSRLTYWTQSSPELTDDLNSVLEIPPEARVEGAPWELNSSRNVADHSPSYEPAKESVILLKELSALLPGRDKARAYELLCCRIIAYLFGDAITSGKPQLTTEDKLNRFDYVSRVKPASDFWKFIATDLGSRYVLFEFKNYREPISQGQILTTEKYLFACALRTVGIVFTRKGASTSAAKMMQGAMREHGKLMVVLDDACIRRMLSHKDAGLDPSDILFDTVDAFLIGLSR